MNNSTAVGGLLVSIVLLLILPALGYKYRRYFLLLFDGRCCSHGIEHIPITQPRIIYERGNLREDGLKHSQTVLVKPGSFFNRTQAFQTAFLEKIEHLTISIISDEPVDVRIVAGGVGYNHLVAEVTRPKLCPVEVIADITREPTNPLLHKYVLLQQGDMVGELALDDKIYVLPKKCQDLSRQFPRNITGVVVGAVSEDKMAYASIENGGIGQQNINIAIMAGSNTTEVCVKIFTDHV